MPMHRTLIGVIQVKGGQFRAKAQPKRTAVLSQLIVVHAPILPPFDSAGFETAENRAVHDPDIGMEAVPDQTPDPAVRPIVARDLIEMRKGIDPQRQPDAEAAA
jgi:hypothetical protein